MEHSRYLDPDIPAWGYLVLMPVCSLHTEFANILKQNHSTVYLSHFLLCKLWKTPNSNATCDVSTKPNTVEEDDIESREHQTYWMREAWKYRPQPMFLARRLSFLQVLPRLAADTDFVGWNKHWSLFCILRNGSLVFFLQSSALSQHYSLGKQLDPVRNIPVCTHAAHCFSHRLFHSAF